MAPDPEAPPRPPATEAAAARYAGLEDWPVAEMVAGLAEAHMAATAAVQAAVPALAAAVSALADRLAGGGRLVALGAGTSGRIAAQDLAELPPTFAWPAARALALMAGGPAALQVAVEGAEDDRGAAEAAVAAAAIGPADAVIGLAASGATPWTLAALAAARARGALTVAVFNSPGAPLADAADHPILLATGAEAVAGSTRMKAGTAQKAALNILTTGAMVRLGHVYRGRMVAMRPTNAKLRARALAMVADLTGADPATAGAALAEAGGSIRTAVAMLALGLGRAAAEARLAAAGGRLSQALARD